MILKEQIVTFFFLTIFLGAFCIGCNGNREDEYTIISKATHTNGHYFVGSQTCIECHGDLYQQHIQTAHFKTSSVASETTIKGSFYTEKNSLTINEYEYVKMEKKGAGYYQNTYNKLTDSLIASYKIDMVIGSGVKGQSFLNWRTDSLYQLHASYFSSSDSWVKSPGYKDKIIDNNRRITARCLECHTTYVETKKTAENTYDRNRIIRGIDCERCHGPSGRHVKYHKENPSETSAKHIVSIRSLTRQQQLDVCALCHSGPRKNKMKPEFSFLTGDNLSRFSSQDFFSTRTELDVHGNQYGLLKASKCFQETKTMTCITCHSPHEQQRNKKSLFINTCISCHDTNSDCKLTTSERLNSKQNCIDCHMPKVTSKSMFKKSLFTKDTISVSVYSHFIGIYPEVVKLQSKK